MVLLVGPSVATNRWIATVADSGGYRIASQPRFDSLWGPAATSADVVLLECQHAHANAVIAALEGSTPATRHRTLLLTWRLHWDTIERALRLDVADFQTMPCRTEELVARMRAARVRAASREQPFDSVDSADLAGIQHPLANAGSRVHLTARERALYRALAAREGEIVSRSELLAVVWRKAATDTTASKIVDVYVRYLRVKLAAAMPGVGIETVKRAGYVLRRTSRSES
jgi:DNA-binding response OmpR family regulator